ncbi:MAG: ribosome-associated protein [Actinomycetota bacterium]|jgi:ribosome-associated protein
MVLKAETISLTKLAVAAADEKLAKDIVALDLSNQGILADVFLIVTGANDPQLESISDEIQRQLQKAGERPIRREGIGGSSQWILLDYGDLIVHIQHPEVRSYYALERLWSDCPKLTTQVGIA